MGNQCSAAAEANRIAALEISEANRTHSALVFIKPHAVTEKVKTLVKEQLAAKGIGVLSEGSISAEDIDAKALIDTHYGAIAAKAVKQKPSELLAQPAPKEEFKKLFGLSWEDALSKNVVFNAVDGAQQLNITTEELGTRWTKLENKKDLLKFGGGFYVGKVGDIFVINAFYMAMRGKFTAPGKCIYYFETDWDARTTSWENFRKKVLGATNPEQAEEGSIRRLIFKDWKALGLESCPNTSDNGVHGSASPFEALAERCNWLSRSIEEDFFGKALGASGIPVSKTAEWFEDPAVNFDGGKKSLFDLLEDLDSRDCLKKSVEILAQQS